MRINKDGMVYRAAYAFRSESKQPSGYIDGCTLLWRFLICGFLKVAINSVFFAIFLLLALALPFYWAGVILLGRRFVAASTTDTNKVKPPNFISRWTDEMGNRI